ncbi:UPF0481 protein At3g47200-like [Miscanthus floridulus]|uniref:UPF0481 protein At3g47200-like n=1 Tax=Miscanthus floridulus TaxID=154761 RepID=UPI0034573F72
MATIKSNQADSIDTNKMTSYMNREINLYWSAFESNDGNNLRSIHKVPQHLLQVDQNSYEPIILSIGPYRHGAQNLIAMEREKWKCLDFILKLNCELSLQDYIRAIYKIEKQARFYYSQDISMNKRKFVQMLLLDSCFILVKVDGTVGAPIPLEEADTNGEECHNSGQAVESNSVQIHATDTSVHEIELTNLRDNEPEPQSNRAYGYDCSSSGEWYANFVWHDLFLLENQIPFFIIETVYNIALSKCRDRGVLEVPRFVIDENTESLFENLIALEQTDPRFGNDITAYIAFMSQFVSTSEDVVLLARRGIIVHMLDSDDEVSAMFTRLGTNIFFDFGTDSYHYLKILCHTLEEYYQSRLNRWMAWLWRNHFSNPWLALGVFAAIVVLVCTIVQTIFTVLAYRQPR